MIQSTTKVLILGNGSVGKTSIIKKYCYGMYTDTYKSTIGVDFALKTITLNEKEELNFQLWGIKSFFFQLIQPFL